MTQTEINITELTEDILNIETRLTSEDNPIVIEKLQYEIKILKSLRRNQ